jgi:hypothetical protein
VRRNEVDRGVIFIRWVAAKTTGLLSRAVVVAEAAVLARVGVVAADLAVLPGEEVTENLTGVVAVDVAVGDAFEGVIDMVKLAGVVENTVQMVLGVMHSESAVLAAGVKGGVDST